MEPKESPRLHLRWPNSYHPHLKEWSETLTTQEVDFRRHNFGNSKSLLIVKIDQWLIESPSPNGTLQIECFRAIDLCSTIEEYSKILGVRYDKEFFVFPLPNQGFKSWMSETLWIKKKSIHRKGGETNGYSLTRSAIYFPVRVPLNIIE